MATYPWDILKIKKLRFRSHKLLEYLGDKKKTLGTESSNITEVDLEKSLKKKSLTSERNNRGHL